MKLLKVLGLTLVIPFLAIGLSSCNSRQLFDVQIRNSDEWNDTFNIHDLRGDIKDLINEAISNNLNFDYGVAEEAGNTSREATAASIEMLLNDSDVLEDNQRHANWNLEDIEVIVLREDNVFAFRSVVIIQLRDADKNFDLIDLDFDANFVYDVTGETDVEGLTISELRTNLQDAIALRTISFILDRQTANAEMIKDFVLNFINNVLYAEEFDLLEKEDLTGNISINTVTRTISWTITLYAQETSTQ